jgi:flagellar hook-associated protein 2
MAITASGVGSGLDINGIVYQLMQLERIPVDKLGSRNRDLDAQLSGYGKLRSSLSSFETAMEGLGSLDKFKLFSSVSSNEDVLTATSNSQASSGTYNISVNRLAQNHKVGSSGATPIASTDIFTGSLGLTIGGETITVNTGTGMTLAQIRDAINSDETNPGLTASIINLGTADQKLVLTADESGAENEISVTDSTTNTSNASATLSLQTLNKKNDGVTTIDSVSELDASFTVDGFSVTASSNSVSDVVQGITLNLQGIGDATLTLSRDDTAIQKSVENFVKAYNDLYDVIDNLAKGDLSGDSTLRTIQSSIRSIYSSTASGLTGTFQAPFQVGIKSDSRTGKLSLDATDLKSALDKDFASVADLFASDDKGVAFRLADLAKTLLTPNNAINTREEGIRARQRTINTQIDSYEARLELKEVALRAKFASLDSLIGSMQSMSSFISSSLG